MLRDPSKIGMTSIQVRNAVMRVLILVGAAACTDDPARVAAPARIPVIVPPSNQPHIHPTAPRPEGLVVSDPVPAMLTIPQPGLPAQSVSGAEPAVVYVSVAAGAIPQGVSATVRNSRKGSLVIVPVNGGGFDPVAVGATVGDTMEIGVDDAAGTAVHQGRLAVDPRRRPIVVRTDPPPRKRDVTLNSPIVIVFSEPIDSATLDGAVWLLRGADVVAGRLEFSDPRHLAARFVPSAPLAPDAFYELVVTQAIRDLDGDELEEPVSVEFTTEPPGDAATQLAIVTQPSSVTAGAVLTPAIQVIARDAVGNTATTFGGSISIAIGTNPAGGVLSGTTTIDAVAGVASFADLSIAQPGNGYRLVATASGVGGDTSAPFNITPALAPLTGRVAFGGAANVLSVMNADGSGVRTFPAAGLGGNGSGFSSRLSWSPDGSRIVFAAFCCVAQEIVTIAPDGSNATNLTNHPADDYDPAWSPDGSKIAFMSARDARGYGDLFVMNADGSGVTRMTNDDGLRGTYWDTWPTWSPDGQKIAFQRLPYDSVDGYWGSHESQIWVVNADGSGLARLGTRTFGEKEPAWSPDGTRIAFVTYCGSCSPPGNEVGIWIGNADGTGATRLTYERDYTPEWTPDGRILFTRFVPMGPGSYTTKLHIMNADGSGVTLLNQPPGDNDSPAFSPVVSGARGRASSPLSVPAELPY